MPTLGEELRRMREEQGITLAEISETTRIGTRFLKAIEDNNFSVLPGGIYTRNFIRSYAERVGMNENEAITLYHQQMTGQTGDLPVAPHESVRAFPVESHSRRPETIGFRQPRARTNWSTIVIAAGIVLIVLIIVISLVQQLNGASSPEVEPDSSASSGQPQSSATAGTGQGGQPSTEAATEPAKQPVSEPRDLSRGEPIRVKLEATTEPSSIQFWIDDETKASHLLVNPGETHELPPARDQIRLNIGNRAVLKMRINDREATFPPDTQKFAARVTVTRDNLEMFFPQHFQ